MKDKSRLFILMLYDNERHRDFYKPVPLQETFSLYSRPPRLPFQ